MTSSSGEWETTLSDADQLLTESEAAPGAKNLMKKIAENEEVYNSPQEESDSWQPDFSNDEEEEEVQFEDAPPQEKDMLTVPKSKSTPRPMLKSAPSTPATFGHSNLTAKKYVQDTSDAEMPIGSTPLRHTRGTSRGPKGAKRKESLEPKATSPIPKEVRHASTPISPLKPPMDWSKTNSKEEFLNKTTEEMMVDPASRKGINIHVARCYYLSGSWSLSSPDQLVASLICDEGGF